MIGVNFQPGTDQQQQGQNGQTRPSSQGVQEAIKVLSLRLPRHPITNGVAPAPLLQSRGGQGNPQVDSVVQQILQRMFPQAAPQGQAPPPMAAPMLSSPQAPPPAPAPAPMMPSGIDGNDIPGGAIAPAPMMPPPQAPPENPQMPFEPQRQAPSVDDAPDFWRRAPRITVGPNPTLPDFPSPFQPIEMPLTGGSEIPPWLRFGQQQWGGGGGQDPEPPAMF